LNRQLGKRGYPVIEVYPHATKVILFGDKAPPKNNPGSVPFLKQRFTPLIQGLEPHLDAMDRNTCDAVLNAYTGVLHQQHCTDMLGSEDEGMLALPQLPH
jgi:predicted nuclease with RNAse H fold